MEHKWEISYFSVHHFLIQKYITGDIVERCRNESPTFNSLCKELIKKDEDIWYEALLE